jgi:O-antigen ligase
LTDGTPSPLLKSGDWSRRVGLFGLYLFTAFALLGITPATVGLILLTLAFVIGFRHWRILGRDPLAATALVFALYVTIHSLLTYLSTPIDAQAKAAADAGVDWVRLLLFIPFAFWVGGCPERVRILLLLALAGFMVGALRKVGWTQLDASFFTTRFETYLPALAFGMFSGLGALGLIALRERFWRTGSGRTPRWLRLVSWLALLAFTLEGLMLSYSRASWLAFAAAAALLAYLEWRGHRAGVLRGTRIAAVLVVAFALALPIALQHRQIADRLEQGGETFSKVLSGDFADVPSDTNGLRVHALRYALELWAQRPWLGWGAGSSRYLLSHSGRPELMMDQRFWLPHLHNTYAEILVQLGIVGFALFAVLLLLLARAAAFACREGRLPGDLCRLFAVSLLFVLIWNLGDYRLVRHDYNFFFIIFAGTVYSFRLRFLLEEGRG